jgi:DNA-binding response OmpR family regulator
MDRDERTSSSPSQPHILIVEAEPAQRRLFAATLGSEQFAVEFVASPRGALRRLVAVDFPRPDVLLMDSVIGGIRVDHVLRTVRLRLGSTVPSLLVVSGLGGEDMRARALEAGADGYLAKPFSPSTLRAEVLRLAQKTRSVGVRSSAGPQPPPGSNGKRSA